MTSKANSEPNTTSCLSMEHDASQCKHVYHFWWGIDKFITVASHWEKQLGNLKGMT